MSFNDEHAAQNNKLSNLNIHWHSTRNGASVAYTMNSSRNETENQNAKERNPKRAREVKGWAIGPMPEEQFLYFLPYNDKDPPSIASEVVVRGPTVDILREEN